MKEKAKMLNGFQLSCSIFRNISQKEFLILTAHSSARYKAGWVDRNAAYIRIWENLLIRFVFATSLRKQKANYRIGDWKKFSRGQQELA